MPMKALITAHGNTAIVADIDIPEPRANEVRIKVHSLALNPVDAFYTASPADAPGRVVGSDFAGTIDQIGQDVTLWKIGDRVAGFNQGATSGNLRPGSFAEFAILEADLAIGIPSAVSFEEAATFPLCAVTAAQVLFITLGLNAPFPNPAGRVVPEDSESSTILIYSAATAVGLFAVELARAARTPSGKPYRIFATASPKHHERLLARGVEAVFDYRSPTWREDVRNVSGGISGAVDCISENDSTAMVSETFRASGGTIAVVRKSAWSPKGIPANVIPTYSAAWSGLGHEVRYGTVWQGLGHEVNYNRVLPASPSWRAMTVEFYKFLSGGSSSDSSRFPIDPLPARVMPGGLERIVPDGFALLGYRKVVERDQRTDNTDPWMKPISGEKLVYNLN